MSFEVSDGPRGTALLDGCEHVAAEHGLVEFVECDALRSRDGGEPVDLQAGVAQLVDPLLFRVLHGLPLAGTFVRRRSLIRFTAQLTARLLAGVFATPLGLERHDVPLDLLRTLRQRARLLVEVGHPAGGDAELEPSMCKRLLQTGMRVDRRFPDATECPTIRPESSQKGSAERIRSGWMTWCERLLTTPASGQER
ncbi:hypothetical protein [Microbacterium azadirachtae]|uniref:hypothetical protein n=1 Tax=Microbacterium azadirachtae TaxID=582680 RepID=UPI001269CCB6|nr:hypothetical protein [Microbacterium azadirachtae]